jgi:arginyl-tRNA synthetase
MIARNEIKNLLEKAIKKLYGKELGVKIDRPAEPAFGDYTSNIAMVLKKNPQEIADSIKSDILEKIEVKNGFVNFFISKEYLQKKAEEILKKKDRFGDLNLGKGRKVDIECICANPTGELHIGHGRGAFLGETLSNVFRKSGFRVSRSHYANDAKSSSQIRELGKTALGEGTTYLNEYLKEKIDKLKPEIGKCKDEKEAGSLLAQSVQKDIKSFIENKLKIRFDFWISEENDLYKKGKINKMYDWLKAKNLVYEKDGAQWLKTSSYGDSKDWVIIRESGEFTYLLPDIAYHKDRFDRKYDKIINIWGADHQAHVNKIKAVGKILGYKGELVFLITQVVRLKGEKMSKRKGKVVTLKWLINEVGLDAVRFIYLMKSSDTQMEFDVALAKDQSEKNPVFYVQYAHARICSILRKLRNEGLKLKPAIKGLKLLIHPSELGLIKQLIRFPEIIEDTANDYQAQRISQYASDLAVFFHQFYHDCRVISEDVHLSEARLGLALATKIILKNTLSLMGISAPEKM